MEEILICGAIAIAIILGLGLIIAFILWLDENKGTSVTISALIIASFIIITYGVWLVRDSIRESEEAKLERRRIQYTRTFRR